MNFIWALSETLAMRSKQMSMQVNEAVIMMKTQNKPIREIYNVAHYKKENLTDSNIKSLGKLQKITVGDDGRILSSVKQNPFTTFSQVKNTITEMPYDVKVYIQEPPS